MKKTKRRSAPANPLKGLAKQINEAHDQCNESLQATVRHAVRAGELLIQAKAKVSYGEWLHWVQVNCHFSERTCQAYMQLAHELPLLDPSKAQRVADLSFRQALKAIADATDHSSPAADEKQSGFVTVEIEGPGNKAEPHPPKVVYVHTTPHTGEGREANPPGRDEDEATLPLQVFTGLDGKFRPPLSPQQQALDEAWVIAKTETRKWFVRRHSHTITALLSTLTP